MSDNIFIDPVCPFVCVPGCYRSNSKSIEYNAMIFQHVCAVLFKLNVNNCGTNWIRFYQYL